jgi:hypothetical protein
MLAEADRPLNAAIVDDVTVRIEGSEWASINDRQFSVAVVSRPMAQFRLLTADTTGEEAAAVGGSVWFQP